MTLGAAAAIGAAAFAHSSPAAAHEWVAPAASHCYGAYYGGGNCCGNELRGLFTSGFFGGCGCGVQQHPSYVEPYYERHPYIGPYYRHHYRSYLRRYSVYHGHSVYHHHGVYRAHHQNTHIRHW